MIESIKNKDFYITVATVIPSLSLEYDHWVSEKVALGVELTADTVSGLPKFFVSNVSLMPSVKYKWGSAGIVDFYSKFAAGYMHCVYAADIDGTGMLFSAFNTIQIPEIAGNNTVTTNRHIRLLVPPFAYQLTLFGVSVPTAANGLTFFHEIGIGTQGSSKFGLKLTF